MFVLFFFKQKTAYEMRISDWSSDVCSSDLLGLPVVAALDPVTDAMSNILGQETRNRAGRKYIMDEAYFARIDAIQFTIAHDDGMNWENWEEADIVLAGVSRASKTPTSIYLANRGYKTANIPKIGRAHV